MRATVVVLFLACLSGPASGQFPCRDAVSNTRPMPGAFIPQCRRSGLYAVEQCHGSTGYCWCVDQVSGEEVDGTKTEPTEQNVDCAPHALTCSAEHAAVMEALGGRMMPGAFAPQCDGDRYRPEQRHGSTGESWCVHPVSGIKDESSHLARGENRDVPCAAPPQPEGPASGQFPCRDAVSNTRPMPGAFIPQCRRSGLYTVEQCHGSTGYCWCVDQVTGQEVAGTKTGPTVPNADCREHALTCPEEAAAVLSSARPGAFVPQCERDLYSPRQRHPSTGESWCVDFHTGEKLDHCEDYYMTASAASLPSVMTLTLLMVVLGAFLLQ